MMNFLAGSGTSPLVRLENALALHSRTISTKKHRFLNFEASHGRTKSCTTCHVNKFHFKPPSNPACDLLTGLVKKPQRLAAWRIVSGAGICSGWFIREKPLLLTGEVVSLYELLATIDLTISPLNLTSHHIELASKCAEPTGTMCLCRIGKHLPVSNHFPLPTCCWRDPLAALQSLFVQRKGKQHLSLEPMPTPPKASKCHSNKEIRRW